MDAVEQRLQVLVEEKWNRPRLNTELHRWKSDRRAAVASGATPQGSARPRRLVGIRGSVTRARNQGQDESLTMIVRNEQENLPHCLSSVAGLFDEIVVVDTGSTDRTRGDRPGIRRPGVRFRLGR